LKINLTLSTVYDDYCTVWQEGPVNPLMHWQTDLEQYPAKLHPFSQVDLKFDYYFKKFKNINYGIEQNYSILSGQFKFPE